MLISNASEDDTMFIKALSARTSVRNGLSLTLFCLEKEINFLNQIATITNPPRTNYDSAYPCTDTAREDKG